MPDLRTCGGLMLELRTFGGLSIKDDGAQITGAATQRKTLALLALLATAGKNGLSRDKLIAYLWPESESEHGRNLLNQACYALRRDLHAPALFLGATELRLNPDVIRSDLQLFEDALARGDPAGAVELYTRPFLDGFYLRGAGEFERWMEAERARLARQVFKALETLATRAEAGGEHRAAERWWRQLGSLDPLNSRAALGVMTALAALGEVPEALQHARAYEAGVREQFGAVPESSLSDLVNRLSLEAAGAEGVTQEDLRLAGTSAGHRRTVGYEKERRALRAGLQSAVAGRGLVVGVAGEPGSGKTTLVEDLLGELAAGGRPCHVALGRCSERLAGSGAYVPLLDALEGLARVDSRGTVTHLMRELAPNWYAQITPSLQNEVSDKQAPERQAASQERLKRELNAFFREVCRLRSLVLFLDDVHWADASTIDIVAYIANQMGTAQMLILVTYRPSELALTKHPFGPLKLELQSRGLYREATLDLLTQGDIARFLALEFPDHHFPQTFEAFVHAKTEGSPLFMVDLLRYLRAKQVIVADNGGWRLNGSVPDLERELPESVRGMIERKIEQLGDSDRQLLTVAGVQGYEFDSSIVAQVVGSDACELEERLDRLARIHGMVRPLRELQLPDGTPAARYRFIHVLYQNVLYARLNPTRRAALSRAVAEALLAHHGDRKGEIAPELALLYEMGRDIPRALQFFALAAERAAAVFAYREVVVLAQRGLALLGTLPNTSERAGLELALQLRLGYALRITKGYADPEPARCMERARELCQQVGDSGQLFPATTGLWGYYSVGGDMQAAREMAEDLLHMADRAGDPILFYGAHTTLATSLCYLGEHCASHDHSERAITLYDPRQRAAYRSLYRRELGVFTWGESTRILWFFGYPDRATRRMKEAIVLARDVAEPEMWAYAHCLGAQLLSYLREPEPAQLQAEACIAVAEEHGVAAQREWAKVVRAWAIAEQGAVNDGIALLRETLATQRTMRLMLAFPWWLGLLAGMLAKEEQIEEGLAAIREGLEIAARGGQRYCEPELLRLKGELLLRGAAGCDQAESCFREAIAIAGTQEAKSLELRGATSLARLWRGQGQSREARDLLAPVYGWFTEGFDTADLREAKALLDELA